ncbi:DUF3870 domain-containing protein, partial [Siminovitchia fortis]|uniref:DUF3870 domain-containing protein n=1 Tax=Siminovitchia fortis TaxID=254758 RepID=UPI0036F2B719
KNNNLFLTRFPQFPKATPIFQTQNLIPSILLIHTNTHIIKNPTFTFLHHLTNPFSPSLIIPYSIKHHIHKILQNIQQKLIIPPKKPLIQPLISARKPYIQT